MKFAHMADVHLGAWRDPRMEELVLDAFATAVNRCVEADVDFVLISGDFLNTSLPGIDVVRFAVEQLVSLQEAGINTYIIPGSHDFSTSGKTMLNVIEEAGVVTNVCKGESVDGELRLEFTVDPETDAKITGLLGKRGGLERNYYKELDRDSLESEDGFKIFMFHSAIEELKPKKYEHVTGAPLSFLPTGFDYYAGGHVHTVSVDDVDGYENIVYPGPLFPASFDELEDLRHGGFYIYDDGSIEREEIMLKNVVPIDIDADGRSAESVSQALDEAVEQNEFVDAIVLIRVHGELSSGKASDTGLNDVVERMYDKGAYFVMKNTSKLTTDEFESVKVERGSPEEIETRVLEEHLGGNDVGFDELSMARRLMQALSKERDESEKKKEYKERVKSEGLEAFGR